MINDEIIAAIKRIKPLSPRVIDLLRVSASDNHSLEEVLAVIRADTVLTAAVLKVANSAAFRPARMVDSLSMAISLLGERVVVGIALEFLSEGFFDQPLDGYESAEGDLWRHGLKTAIAARLLCRYARSPIDGNLAFTAGILHDIGKVVMSHFLVGSAKQLAFVVSRGGEKLSYLDAERRKLGCDHCEAGVVLAEQWKLPEGFRDAIAFHHTPEQAPAEHAGLVFAVHVGDIIAMMAGSGTGSDSMLYQLRPAHVEWFDLSPEKTQLLMLDVEMEFTDIESSLQG